MSGSLQSDTALNAGAYVSVDMADGSSLRAFVHACDTSAGLVCLELVPSAELALVAIESIRTVTNLPDRPDKRRWPSSPVVDVARLQSEQEKAFRKRNTEFEYIGVGVSTNAQAIFDALVKTLPCRWDNQVIVVLDCVRLAPPYDVESISGEGEAGVIQRVKIILEHEAKAITTAVDTNGVTT